MPDTITRDGELPAKLNTPEFIEIWADWHQHRIEITKKLKPTCERYQLKKLAKLDDVKHAMATVKLSIENGWMGLFPEQAEIHQQPESAFDKMVKEER